MSNVIELPKQARGDMVQISEGHFVVTSIHADARGEYVIAYPYTGQASKCEMVPGGTGESVPRVDQPSAILADIAIKVLGDFWGLKRIKQMRFEWNPEHRYWYVRFSETDYCRLERENDHLRARVVRLEQELGRRPMPPASPTPTPAESKSP